MSTSSDPRTGFTLPAVLAVMGVITLIFLVAITALSSLTAEAASSRARIRFMERALSAEAQFAFLAATEPFQATGLAIGGPRYVEAFGAADVVPVATGEVFEVRLDGRPYRLESERGAVLVGGQDQAGLVNLAYLGADGWRRAMDRLGLSAARADTLRAQYIDYTDVDTLTQIDGAEAGDYPAGREPPNRNLLRPTELLSVLEAREAIPAPAWRALRRHLAADASSAQFNINTATPQALSIQFGLSDDQAAAAVLARETLVFRSLTDLGAAGGTTLLDDGERSYNFPSPHILVSVRDLSSAWTYRARISLSPGDLERPFWIEQTELSEASDPGPSNIDDVPDLPVPSR